MHFHVRVDENNQRNINMVELRAKIRSYFIFNADVNFSLRYVDEEGDLVNLVDDDDLDDMMRQKLEFLRIEVDDNVLRKKITRYAWSIFFYILGLDLWSRCVQRLCLVNQMSNPSYPSKPLSSNPPLGKVGLDRVYQV
ncbi:PB1 domain protein [Medicago truncatula]|uniref:PB1 domain protein n=1 Tax=Medicago truncatula TaxID=3880 RepID=A0A072V0Y5_MEDTR|nr:PB1 domain protein [Medicago truncatula]